MDPEQSLTEQPSGHLETELTLSDEVMNVNYPGQSLTEQPSGHLETELTLSDEVMNVNYPEQSLTEQPSGQLETKLTLSDEVMNVNNCGKSLTEQPSGHLETKLTLSDEVMNVNNCGKSLTEQPSGHLETKLALSDEVMNVNDHGQSLTEQPSGHLETKLTLIDEVMNVNNCGKSLTEQPSGHLETKLTLSDEVMNVNNCGKSLTEQPSGHLETKLALSDEVMNVNDHGQSLTEQPSGHLETKLTLSDEVLNVNYHGQSSLTEQPSGHLETELTLSDEVMNVNYCGQSDTENKVTKNVSCKEASHSFSNDNFSSFCLFDMVPQEIILKIFSYLRPQELCHHVAPVCRKWHSFYDDPLLWQELDLSKSNNTVLMCHVIRRFPFVKSLIFSEQLSVPIAMVITDHCSNLEKLNVRFSRNIDSNILDQFVVKCRKLSSINVEGCPLIDAAAVKTLSSAPSLTSLNFSHCVKLVDDDLICLAVHLPKIISLNIDGISYITDISVKSLIRHHHQHLESLVIDGEELTDSSIEAIAECCKLTQFSISFCTLLTDQSLRFLKEPKELKYLCMRKGCELSSAGFCDLFSTTNLSHLSYLNLTECVLIDDQAVLAFAQCCGPSLVTLILAWCWNISDIGLTSIIDHCSNLHELELIGVKRIRGDCLDRIPQDVPLLTFLDLQQCNLVEDTILYELVREKVDLKILDYYGQCIMYYNHHLYTDFNEAALTLGQLN